MTFLQRDFWATIRRKHIYHTWRISKIIAAESFTNCYKIAVNSWLHKSDRMLRFVTELWCDVRSWLDSPANLSQRHRIVRRLSWFVSTANGNLSGNILFLHSCHAFSAYLCFYAKILFYRLPYIAGLDIDSLSAPLWGAYLEFYLWSTWKTC